MENVLHLNHFLVTSLSIHFPAGYTLEQCVAIVLSILGRCKLGAQIKDLY